MADRLFTDPRLAELYDLWHPGRERDDFRFYLPLIMSAGSVLDAGCGTGELLGMARQAGHAGRLCGLDPAAGMLQRARQRPDIEWVTGDAASMTWEGEFDLVIMTGHAFQVFVTDEEIRASLAAIRSALTPQGRFAFETRNPQARAWERWTPAHAVETVTCGGAAVRKTEAVVTPFDGHTVTFTSTFTSPQWDAPKVSRSTLRFLGAGPLASFLAGAGLVISEQSGDWDRQPLTPASPEIITICRPA